MIFAVIFLILPVGIYLTLASLPQGRMAWSGFFFALALMGLAWLLFLSGIGPLETEGAFERGLMSGVLSIFTGVVLAAGVAQVIRGMLSPDRPIWLYPLVALAILAIGGFPALLYLGV